MGSLQPLIVRARVESGLSKSAFAQAAGTSRSAIDEYESGRRSPSVDTLERILDRVGLDLNVDVARRVPDDVNGVPNEVANDLASFGGVIDQDDPAWTWRLLTSDFLANVFVPATAADRIALVGTEPATSGCVRHDAFIAAIAEHAAVCAEIPVPGWAVHATRLGAPPVWFPVHGELASTRAAAMAFSPAAFRRRCIQVDGRDLPRIDR